MNNHYSRVGVTLLEVVFAMLIFMGSVVPMFGHLTGTFKSSKKAEYFMTAQNLSKSIMNVLLEKVRFKTLKDGYYAKDTFTDDFDSSKISDTDFTAYDGGWGPINIIPLLSSEKTISYNCGSNQGGIEAVQLDMKKSDGTYYQLSDYIDFEKNSSGKPSGNGRIIKHKIFFEFMLRVKVLNSVKFEYYRNMPQTIANTKPSSPDSNAKASISADGEIKKLDLFCYWIAENKKMQFVLSSYVVKNREDTD